VVAHFFGRAANARIASQPFAGKDDRSKAMVTIQKRIMVMVTVRL
jgi:hypothetical protein